MGWRCVGGGDGGRAEIWVELGGVQVEVDGCQVGGVRGQQRTTFATMINIQTVKHTRVNFWRTCCCHGYLSNVYFLPVSFINCRNNPRTAHIAIYIIN